jgi:anti-sigma B factor antagonist
MMDQLNSTTASVDHDQMSITSEQSTVHVSGELDMDTADELAERLLTADERGRPIKVDMSGVTFIDSTAISTLLKVADQREVKIVNASTIVEKVLDLVGLGDRFGLV